MIRSALVVLALCTASLSYPSTAKLQTHSLSFAMNLHTYDYKGSLLQVSQDSAANATEWINLLDNQTNSNITLDSTADTVTATGTGTQVGIGQTLKVSQLSSLEFSFYKSDNVICFGVVENRDNVTIDNIFQYPDAVNMICTNDTQNDLFPIVSSTTQVGQTYQLVVDRNYLQLHFLNTDGDGYWVGNYVNEAACYIVYVFEDAGILTVTSVEIAPEETAAVTSNASNEEEGIWSSEESSEETSVAFVQISSKHSQKEMLKRGTHPTPQKYLVFH